MSGPVRRALVPLAAGAALVAGGLVLAAGEEGSAEAPYVLVLGTAQDGGIPHLGGRAAPDEAARRDPSLVRRVASLLICDPATGGRWLIDATPDLPEQLERAEGHPATRRAEGPRPAPVDGVLLTHAHIGHYLGLAQFGREVYGADHLPVHVSARMAAFLADNGPWNLLIRLGHVELVHFEPGRPIRLAPGLEVTPVPVPHRDELSDTVGFEIRGPRRALFYLPDIDQWQRWQTPVEQVVARVDVALLDGTFYGEGELPGRSMATVPHPLITASIARFAKLPAEERAKIRFTHLNHTNPAALPGTPERRAVEAAGMSIAEDGDRIDL